jgi:hypothetical protein
MSTNDDLVAVLLRNADLLLAFNSQAAILPNSTLEEALAAARKKDPLDFHSVECVALRREVLRLTNAIKPATLSELHNFPPYTGLASQDPAVAKARRRDELFRYSLAVLALVLFIFCGKYTIWSKDATILMEDIEAAQNQLASERFNNVLSRWQTLMVLELQNGSTTYAPPDVNAAEDFQLYREHVESFLSIEARRASLMAAYSPIKAWWENWTAARAVKRGAKAPPEPEGETAADTKALPVDGGGYSTTSADPLAAEEPLDQCLEVLNARMGSIFERARRLPTIKINPDGSIGTGQSPPAVLEESHVKAWVAVEMRNAHRDAFICFFKIPPDRVATVETTRTSYLTTLRSVRDRLDVLNSWILPGIYGALGAVLLTLRVYVNPVQPNPRRFRTIMRITLGGFVGIVVGWFWSPQSNQLFEFANISVGLFTMAFLFGYGIDVFMNLLDKVVGGFSSAIENAGSKP